MGCDHKHVLKDYVLRSIFYNKCWNDTDFTCNKDIRLCIIVYIKLTKIICFATIHTLFGRN